MKPENELALIAGFYLAKFDRQGVINLGFNSFRQAFDEIGKRLGVKPNTVKNMRDQFDPMYDARVGWYQRRMPPSRQRVVDAFDGLSETSLRSFVLDALHSREFPKTPVAQELFHAMTGPVAGADTMNEAFAQRVSTGRKAEDYFLDRFRAGKTEFSGELFDARELGAGFDFRIGTGRSELFVEVKGLADEIGGISFTDKEWSVASIKTGTYFAAIVSSVSSPGPRLTLLRDPAALLKPRRYVVPSVSVAWQVPSEELAPHLT